MLDLSPHVEGSSHARPVTYTLKVATFSASASFSLSHLTFCGFLGGCYTHWKYGERYWLLLTAVLAHIVVPSLRTGHYVSWFSEGGSWWVLRDCNESILRDN